MKNLKKALIVTMSMVLIGTMFTACGSGDGGSTSAEDVHVISREEGSGTRGAFIELFGIEQKDADGNKVDHTIDTAEITNSTSVMMQTVAGDEAAIGYISLGSLNDTVKALKVDGVEATLENVKNGTYKISRPFNIVTKSDISEAAQDFINYIMSDEGQAVVTDEGYVSQGSNGAYKAGSASGKVTVSGSSSVTPVMQKLAEEYQKVNTKVTIEVQQSDSTTGISDAVSGISDIGMASRELKDEELSSGITPQVIALDGIAVIVNTKCSISEIAADSVLKIYTGEITKWSDVK